ncbi:unknown [Clostridium sp. CAG:914]|nr:unknown [Clostridium sp. CAG:914]
MTYYELMNTLESIRISPRNSEYINKLNSTTLLVYNDIEPNIKGFIEKIMIYRLSNELNNLLNRIYSIDYDNLSLELVEFQREVIYLEELSKIKIIKDNTKKELINSLFKLSNQFCDELYKNVSYIDTDGRYKELVDSYRFTIKEG